MARGIFLLLMALSIQGLSQSNISGTIRFKDLPIENAIVGIEGSTLSVLSDKEGRFIMESVPLGKQTLVVSAIGFKTFRMPLHLLPDQNDISLTIELLKMELNLEEFVVTGTRTERPKEALAMTVDVLDNQLFQQTQSSYLAEGLCFQSGLRVETDCQTCNFTQLRMNGLGGGYTQLLINSRPIFSALNGLYGLEQIPASMIDQVEIVRGGGSALYGSNAVAGIVNVITRKPDQNGFELSSRFRAIGKQSGEFQLSGMVSNASSDKKRGISILFANRSRQEWDANGDGFSELPRIQGQSIGVNGFIHGSKSELNFSLNSIMEQREGGDRLDLVPHKREQSEQRLSYLQTINADWTRDIGDKSELVLYSGFQNTDRTHYTGFIGSDGYGLTDNQTFQGGIQYNTSLNREMKPEHLLTLGAEYQYDYVFDEIEAYSYLIDQEVSQTGVFAQSDWVLGRHLNLLSGIRLNTHNLVDFPIVTPRVALKYSPTTNTNVRMAYSRGFRAPQAFDADLHIAFAGGGISSIQLSDDLIPEYSNSYSLELDYDKASMKRRVGIRFNFFYTRLENAFVLEEVGADEDGNMRLLKQNGAGSQVSGISITARYTEKNLFGFESGFTMQRSLYDEEVQWSAEIPGTKKYLRTPDQYGYYTLRILPEKAINLDLSGVLTGSMLVPHFAGAIGVERDVLYKSEAFFEQNIVLNAKIPTKRQDVNLVFNAGVLNVFNSYQSDFDLGAERDSNYIYGPSRPRMFTLGFVLRG